MKRIFKIIGLISLTCFSFFITEKTSLVVKNMDDIMISIKENSDDYKKDSINAKIDGDTIIPGISGRKVNINKSYKKMKEYGSYSDKLYVYDYIKPDISLKDNKDKIITNINKKKRMVSLIFMVDNNTNINDILGIINNYNIKATFFITSSYLENNNIDYLKKEGHNIGIIGDSNIEWMNIVIKDKYCYSSDINLCTDNNLYIIKPYIVSSTTPLLDVKNNLENNLLLSFTINKNLKRELPNIIIYIKSKGYTITNLDNSILENSL